MVRPPAPSGIRTVATTDAWCTSNPATRVIVTSIASPFEPSEELLHRDSARRARGNTTGCLQLPRQTPCGLGVPLMERRLRLAPQLTPTFSCRGVTAGHDDSMVFIGSWRQREGLHVQLCRLHQVMLCGILVRLRERD